MTALRRLFIALLPAAWARDMEDESRAWKVGCACGRERSIWEIGGLRWKASGNPRRLLRCDRCRRFSWHSVYPRH